MPLEPPWPIEVLTLLRAALKVLQREERAHPADHVAPAVAIDVSAAIAKLEAAGTRSQA